MGQLLLYAHHSLYSPSPADYAPRLWILGTSYKQHAAKSAEMPSIPSCNKEGRIRLLERALVLVR